MLIESAPPAAEGAHPPEDAHPRSIFDESEDFCGFQLGQTSNMLTYPRGTRACARAKRAPSPEAEEERAAIAEYDGGIPRAWAEGFARLDPDGPPADVPLRRWRTFVD